METVAFFSQGSQLLGQLHRPVGVAKARPGIVVVGSWLTVKEQMPANYAPFVADAESVALTFDFSGFGESQGAPREVESPHRKAEDIRSAVTYLQTLPEVDPDRVGVLAICASAGYTALAALDEPSIKSIAMVAPWLHDAAIVRTLYEGPDGVARRLEQARKARQRYVTTGQVDYVPAASNTDPAAAMYMPGAALDYYLNPTRGAIPKWGARFALMAWEDWLRFDPIALAHRVAVPTLMVTSEQSATPQGAKQFASASTAPHDVVWTTATQFDFYDNPSTVAFAAKRALEHFHQTL